MTLAQIARIMSAWERSSADGIEALRTTFFAVITVVLVIVIPVAILTVPRNISLRKAQKLNPDDLFRLVRREKSVTDLLTRFGIIEDKRDLPLYYYISIAADGISIWEGKWNPVPLVKFPKDSIRQIEVEVLNGYPISYRAIKVEVLFQGKILALPFSVSRKTSFLFQGIGANESIELAGFACSLLGFESKN